MHGLINRSLQCFSRDTYGAAFWHDVVAKAGIGIDSFEAMLTYDDDITLAVVDALVDLLEKPHEDVLEDLGTYLVSHKSMGAVRRLLRFSGHSFIDFLQSLDNLRGRVRLALPDLEFPYLQLRDHAPGQFTISCGGTRMAFGHVLVGVLRAMADDYGALVFLRHLGMQASSELIAVEVLDMDYADGRVFHLSNRHLSNRDGGEDAR